MIAKVKRIPADVALFESLGAIYLISGLPNVLVELFPPYRYMLGLLFLTLVLYPISAFLPRLARLKIVLVLGAILLIAILPTCIFMKLRWETDPYRFAHDGLIQSEAATRFVLEGKNPYVENYRETPMALWPYADGINPALDHYPYLPATFLFPALFQGWSERSLGWFDHRILYLSSYAGLLILAYRLTDSYTRRITLLIAIGLNPLFTYFLIQGRNDVLVLFWLAVVIECLRTRHRNLSAVFMAIACSTKQLAWFFIPFYFVFLGGSGSGRERLRRAQKPFVLFAITLGLFILPWFIANPSAFIEDTLAFQSGLLPDSYPISGVGLGTLLLNYGFLPDKDAYFPFSFLQFLFGAPVAIGLLRRQLFWNSLRSAVIGYAVVLSIVLFFARAFNVNYLGYLLNVIVIGWVGLSSIGPSEESIP